MVFNAEEILALKRLCQFIIERPLSPEEQLWQREGHFSWCEDWEAIEILKYLFNGREAYIGDPPPNRLKGNPLWSKEEIMVLGEGMIKAYQGFCARDPQVKRLAIKDTRGILVLMAVLAQPAFESITCVGKNMTMLERVDFYFRERLMTPVNTVFEGDES